MNLSTFALLVSISVAAATRQEALATALGDAKVVVEESTSHDEDNIVKNEEYVILMGRRAAFYEERSTHSYSQPSRNEGAYYWLEAEDGSPIERCCCPKDTTTGLKQSGAQCKYLHAFEAFHEYVAGHPPGLKQSSNPTKWNEWVCPGTAGMPDGLGWHHPEEADTADFDECNAGNAEIEKAEEDWQQIDDDLDAKLTQVEAELRDLVTGWGCHMVHTGQQQVSGTWCGSGGLSNVHNCGKKGHTGKCYTTACYTCDRLPDEIFHKRKGEGMVVDDVTGKKYISTDGAVKAHALEQCRVACIV